MAGSHSLAGGSERGGGGGNFLGAGWGGGERVKGFARGPDPAASDWAAWKMLKCSPRAPTQTTWTLPSESVAAAGMKSVPSALETFMTALPLAPDLSKERARSSQLPWSRCASALSWAE